MGQINSHCNLHCVALIGPCAINDPWCSQVLLKLNWVCKVKYSSWFPPDWFRYWRYDLVHPRWRSGAIIFLKRLTWPKTPFCQFAQFCTRDHERVFFQIYNSPQRDLFALGCHVDVTVTMELVSTRRCRLRTMRTIVPLASECCPTTCTIHPNLLDEDDVVHSAHVSLGTQKTLFCCSIVSAILASCALPITGSMFWISRGSDHLILHVYHVCVCVYTLELRSVGKGVQRVWLALHTPWRWTRRTRHPRALSIYLQRSLPIFSFTAHFANLLQFPFHRSAILKEHRLLVYRRIICSNSANVELLWFFHVHDFSTWVFPWVAWSYGSCSLNRIGEQRNFCGPLNISDPGLISSCRLDKWLRPRANFVFQLRQQNQESSRPPIGSNYWHKLKKHSYRVHLSSWAYGHLRSTEY